MGITVGGLVSGLDTESIISQLQAIEQKPIAAIQSKQSAYQVQLSAYSSLQSALSSLKSTASNLSSKDNVANYSASSSSTSIVTASAETGAVAGSYSVTVNALAASQKLKSSAFTSTETVGEGTLHLTVGSNTAVDIAVKSTDTITDVAKSINNAGAGVTASAVYDGTNYYLTITGSKTGASNAIKLTATETGTTDTTDSANQDTTGLSRLVYDSSGTQNLTQIRAASDADISVDGITHIKRSSNTIDDVISGVTLSLKSFDTSSTVTVTVAQDNSLLTSRLNSFISAYNTLADSLNNLQSYDAQTQKTGTLFGDSTVKNIQKQLRNMLTNAVSGLSTGSNHLSDMGVSITNTDAFATASKLELNSATFSKKIEADFDSVSKFFTSTTTGSEGFATRMVTALQNILDTSNGTLTVRTKGIQSSIDMLQKQVDNMNTRLSANETRLRTQFSSLEVLLGQYKNTADSLTQQLTTIENGWSSSSSSSSG
jgi:flagellar hook-associated protein 2